MGPNPTQIFCIIFNLSRLCTDFVQEYLPAYHSHFTDLMTRDPTYLSLVGAAVAAVRDNLHRYFNTLKRQLFTRATSDNRHFTSLHQFWQHLDTYFYTNALAAPCPTHNGCAAQFNLRASSSVNVMRESNKPKDPFSRDFKSWPADDGVFSSVWTVSTQTIGPDLPNFMPIDSRR